MTDKNGKVFQFKVDDRRRLAHYMPVQRTEVGYASAGPAPDECEIFRTASFSGGNKSSEPAMALRHNVPYTAERPGNAIPDECPLPERPDGIQRNYRVPVSILAGAAIAAASIGLAYLQSGPAKNRGMADYEEFRRSSKIERTVDVPDDLFRVIKEDTGLGYMGIAHAADLNGDGIDEISVVESCGSGGCWGETFTKRNGSYETIFNGLAEHMSPESSNGFRNLFETKKVYLPWGGFTNVTVKYEMVGGEYVKAGEFLSDDTMKQTVEFTRNYLRDEPNPERRREVFDELSTSIEALNAFDLLVFSSAPPNLPVPEDAFARRQLVDDLSRERGVNLSRYYDNSEGLRRFLFSSPQFVQPRTLTELGITFAALVGKNIQKELGLDAYAQYLQTLRKSNGYLDDDMKRTGRQPNPEELHRILWQGASGAIREDRLPVTRGQDTSTYRTWESPSGSGSSRNFNPRDVTGDPRYLSQPQPESRQQDMSRQIDQQTRQQLQQGAERGRQMFNQGMNKLFGPKDQNKK